MIFSYNYPLASSGVLYNRTVSNFYNSYIKPRVRYETGSTLAFQLFTAGYVTNGAELYFTIPSCKPITGSFSAVTVASVDGFIVRQNGSYKYGSGHDTFVKPMSYRATNEVNHIAVCAIFANPSEGDNNAAAGILWSGRITIS